MNSRYNRARKFIVNENTKSFRMTMTEESDVIDFLREHDGQASLDQISESLDIAK